MQTLITGDTLLPLLEILAAYSASYWYRGTGPVANTSYRKSPEATEIFIGECYARTRAHQMQAWG